MADEDDKKKGSKLAVEKTYGEKWYHNIFESGVNFWLNLAMSGLFSFWVEQSTRPLPKTVFQGKRPREFYQMVVNWFHESPLVKWLPEVKEVGRINPRLRMATVLANCITITFSATAVIIPSTWLGAKIKEPFVRWLDKKHYGADAEKDEHIHERHMIVAQSHRPTLLGAVVSRLGTIGAVTATGLVIGGEQNIVRAIGKFVRSDRLATFEGVDHYTGKIGNTVGEWVAKNFPERSKKINNFFVRHGFDWREGVPHEPGTFNRAVQDWSRWTALDVIYTSVTAMTIAPFVKLSRLLPGMSYKEHIPGITYMPKDKHRPTATQQDTANTAPAQDNGDDRPKMNVSQVQKVSTLGAGQSALEAGV